MPKRQKVNLRICLVIVLAIRKVACDISIVHPRSEDVGVGRGYVQTVDLDNVWVVEHLACEYLEIDLLTIGTY